MKPGDRVEITHTMGVCREGVVLELFPADHLPWPKVRVRHDQPVPDPLDPSRPRDVFDWPDWMVRPASPR